MKELKKLWMKQWGGYMNFEELKLMGVDFCCQHIDCSIYRDKSLINKDTLKKALEYFKKRVLKVTSLPLYRKVNFSFYSNLKLNMFGNVFCSDGVVRFLYTDGNKKYTVKIDGGKQELQEYRAV